MLPTFVIGLREGLEAALIVGIIAAFVGRQGRPELLRWIYAGVGSAVLLCAAVGVALEAASSDLPQKQQEGLETVIGALAVGMVTYMVVWMRRHSRELKKQLEGLASQALEQSAAGRAMVVMAFLAVLREGFETVVFLLAAFHESGDTAQAGGGAVAGIAVAVLLGYGIYRGGVRLNLSKFFRATGIVLVLVAAGLVASALRTAHEAGWLDAGQQSKLDLSAVVRPGSVQSALLTGMLGIQSRPVLIEVAGWLLYLVPVGLYVAWPPHRTPTPRTLVRVALSVAGAGAALAALLVIAAPAVPPANVPELATAKLSGTEQREGMSTHVYTTTRSTPVTDRPGVLTYEQAAALNGGRLPLGVRAATSSGDGTVRVHYVETTTTTLWVDPGGAHIIDLRWTDITSATLVGTPVGDVPLDKPVAIAEHTSPAADVRAAVRAARHDRAAADRRDAFHTAAWLSGLVAALAALWCIFKRPS